MWCQLGGEGERAVDEAECSLCLRGPTYVCSSVCSSVCASTNWHINGQRRASVEVWSRIDKQRTAAPGAAF